KNLLRYCAAVALEQLFDGVRCQVVRPDGGERAAQLPHRGPHRVDDQRVHLDYHPPMHLREGDAAPDFTLDGVPPGPYHLAARRSVFIVDPQGIVRYAKEEPLSLSYRSVDDILHALNDSGLLIAPA